MRAFPELRRRKVDFIFRAGVEPRSHIEPGPSCGARYTSTSEIRRGRCIPRPREKLFQFFK